MIITVLNIVLFLYLMSIIRLDKLFNKGYMSDRLVLCMNRFNKLSKFIGLMIYGLISVLTVFALCVLPGIELYHISIIEIC